MAISVVSPVCAMPVLERADSHRYDEISGAVNNSMQQLTVLLYSSSDELAARWAQGLPESATVESVTDLVALERSLASEKAAIVLFDLALCEGDIATEGASFIRAHLESKVIAMSPMPDTEEGLNLIASGAHGYCNRYVAPQMLTQVINVVEMGEVWLGSSLTLRLLENLAEAGKAQPKKPHAEASNQRLETLTAREQEIARLVGTGAPNKSIASQLDITDRTVKAHLSAIFKKTQTKDRLQLGLLVNTSNL